LIALSRSAKNGEFGMAVDLELVDTDALWRELADRFDHCLFTGLVIRTEDEYAILRHKSGNSMTCMGLASSFQIFLHHELEKKLLSREMEEGNDDDDT
jgi:hypothetical protein